MEHRLLAVLLLSSLCLITWPLVSRAADAPSPVFLPNIAAPGANVLRPRSTPTTAPAPTRLPSVTTTIARPTPTTEPSTTATAAPAAAVYWGAYIGGVPWDMAKLQQFEIDAGKQVSIISWGQSWIHNGQYQPFHPNDLDTVRTHGAIPLLDWGSWDYSGGPTQPGFRLATIAGGIYDSYLQQWAQGAKSWGHPLFLRFDWEMNGWWQFPWSDQLNGNRPGDFVKAWRHVHDIFVSVGATNVNWVWAPNVDSAWATPLANVYPGDAYVDWTAMDGYNWGSSNGNTWQSFSQVFGPTYTQLLQLAPSKTIMIAETACTETDGSKAAWIKDALQTQLLTNYPSIKALVWFNWNDNNPALTWPIESSSSARVAFAQALAAPQYISNRFASLNGTTIPIPHP